MKNIIKNILVIIFFIGSKIIFGQFEYKPDLKSELCLQQIETAQADFVNHNFILHLEKPIPFSDTQQKVILREYGIKSEYKHPFIHDCYQHELISQLNKKYGLDFIKHTMEISKTIDESGKGTRSEKFVGSGLNFQEFIYSSLSKKEKQKLRRKYGKENHYLEYEVDIQGRVWCKSLNIINLDVSRSFKENLAQQKVSEPILFELINGRKLFEPRTKNGIPENSINLLKLNF